MPIRSLKLRRLLKRLIIILSCCAIFYFAFVSLRKKDVILTSESGGNFTDEVQTPTTPREEERKGRLSLSIWRDLCGGEVKVLRNSPLFPSYPSEKKIISEFSEFQIEDNRVQYGQTIAGLVNPVRSGSHRFAIASDALGEKTDLTPDKCTPNAVQI